MHALLKDPAATAALQATAALRYLANDDAGALRVARWFAVASNHADIAHEMLEKAAFRLRRSGILDAERDRIDARRDTVSQAYASDPAVDGRVRGVRGRLARLAALERTLEAPLPQQGPELDAVLRMLCGPHGWYHNMPLPGGRSSFDVGHIKKNSPVTARDHNEFQLALLVDFCV